MTRRVNRDPYVCPICGAESHNPNDARHGYCGRCHAHTRWCFMWGCENKTTTVVGNLATCDEHKTLTGS